MRKIKAEVDRALKKMKLKRAVGPYGILIKVWRCVETIGVTSQTNLSARFRVKIRSTMTREKVL